MLDSGLVASPVRANSAGPLRRGANAAVPLAIYAAVALLLFSRAWRDPFHSVIGLGGDPDLFGWFLEWTAFAVTHHHNPLLTTYLNYPSGVNMMWNTTMTLPGMVLSPATLTAGPVFAYNVLITASPVISAFAAMLAFRRFVDSAAAATVGGLVYGFSPPIVIQSLGHPQITLAFFPPLALLALYELVVTQRHSAVRVGALFGLLTAVQILTGEELLASTALTAAVGIGVLAVLHRHAVRTHLGYAILGLGVAGIVAGVLAAYPLWLQFFGPQKVHGDIQPHNLLVSDLLNFVVPTGFQAIAPASLQPIVAQFTGTGVEYNAYLGIPLIILLLAAGWLMWGIPLVRWSLLVAAVMAVLSLGPHLHIGGHDTGIRLPYVVVDHLPVLGNLLPNRLAMYVDLMAALVVTVSLDRIWRSRRWGPRLAGAAAVLACLVPFAPGFPFPSVPTASPAFFTTVALQRIRQDEVVLVAPYARYPSSSRPMLWQAEARMRYRMPEGYFVGPDESGKAQWGPHASPLSITMENIGLFGRTPELSDSLKASLLLDLHQHHVSAVVVGPMPQESVMVDTFTAVFGSGPEQVGGVNVWWAPDRTAGY